MTETPDLPSDPIVLFAQWFAEAQEQGELASAMAVATVDAEGKPSNRFVLLKGADTKGFVFFTNYQSRKAGEVEQNPHAAAVIFWSEPRRQVRIEGRVERLPSGESDAYFSSRDRMSQIGAVVSPQSRRLANRAELDDAVRSYAQKMEGQTIPRPEHWGGYRIVPEAIEFWAGRNARLHDRFRYTRAGDEWSVQLLAP